MAKKKIFGWVGLIALFVVMGLTAVAFLLASSRPDEWRPFQLRNEDQRVVANRFMTRTINELVNGLRNNEPFRFSVGEDEMNQWLASLDEIAFLTYSREEAARKSSEFVEAMDKAGITDPVVDMRDGTLTLLVRTKNGNKIVSLDLAFEFTDDKQMYIKLDGVRVGLLPVPQMFVTESLQQLQTAMERPSGDLDARAAQDLDLVIGALVRGIGGEPMPTRLPIAESRPKRIERIEITDSDLTIYFVPLPRDDEDDTPDRDDAGPVQPSD